MINAEIDISGVVKDTLQEFKKCDYEIECEDDWNKDYAIFQCKYGGTYEPHISEDEDEVVMSRSYEILNLIKSRCVTNPEIVVKFWQDVVGGPEIEIYREKDDRIMFKL